MKLEVAMKAQWQWEEEHNDATLLGMNEVCFYQYVLGSKKGRDNQQLLTCLPKPQMKSLQCAQNVGCLKKRATNLCPFAWWTFRCLIAYRIVWRVGNLVSLIVEEGVKNWTWTWVLLGYSWESNSSWKSITYRQGSDISRLIPIPPLVILVFSSWLNRRPLVHSPYSDLCNFR